MRNPVRTQHLVVLYTEKHLTLREIGRLVGMSATAVMKRLRQAGITREHGERVVTLCAYCAMPFSSPRSRVRTRRHLFCSAEHYYASRSNQSYVEWRHGSRLARAIVSQHFPLQREHVVHHKDSDQRHNDLTNLEVYASQSDHLAKHHGRAVPPIWTGDQTPQQSVENRPVVEE